MKVLKITLKFVLKFKMYEFLLKKFPSKMGNVNKLKHIYIKKNHMVLDVS